MAERHEDLLRVDDPRGPLPRRVREVVDTQRDGALEPRLGSAPEPRSALPGRPSRYHRHRRASPVRATPAACPSPSGAPAPPGGRPCQQLRPAEVERQRLAPGEPQRTGEVLGHRDPDAIVLVDVHLDEVARSVRRQAGHEQQVEVAPELIGGNVERARHLRQLAPRMLHQERHDHEHPAQPLRGLRCPPSPLRQGAPPGGRRSRSRSDGGSSTIGVRAELQERSGRARVRRRPAP